MAKKHKKHAEHANHERWLVSYADFITLLFAFFVVMFASSQVDRSKTNKMALAVEAAFSTFSLFKEGGGTKKVLVSSEAPSVGSTAPEIPNSMVASDDGEPILMPPQVTEESEQLVVDPTG